MNESRLFIGNLPPGVSEKELKLKLKKYGKLTDVTIKERLDHNGKVTATFAHCSLSSERNIMTCLDELMAEGTWNGHSLKAEVAKKSFDQKRQENGTSSKEKSLPAPAPVVAAAKTSKVKAMKPSKKQAQNGDGSDSGSEDEVFWGKMGPTKTDNAVDFASEQTPKRRRREEEAPTKFYKAESTSAQSDLLRRLEKFSNIWGDSENHSSSGFSSSISGIYRNPVSNESGPARMDEKKHFSNRNGATHESKYSPDKVRSAKSDEKKSYKDQNGSMLEKKNGTAKHFEVSEPSEKKAKRKASTNDEGALAKAAKVSSKHEKKLRSEEQRQQSLNEKANFFKQQQEAVKKALSDKNKKNTKIVFGDDAENGEHEDGSAMKLFDDESGDEEIGAENFKIKKQFEGKKGVKLLEMQSTFGMDERFKLDKRFAEVDNEENSGSEHEDPEIKNQMSILEGIVGPLKKKKAEQKMPSFVRYDPSKEAHDKKYKLTKQRAEVTENEEAEEVLPEVSSERFYEVKSDLKNVLQPNEGFSLRNLFGGANEEEGPANATNEEPKAKRTKSLVTNPFDKIETAEKLQNSFGSTAPTGWSATGETFFFQTNDSRFKDGLEFIKSVKELNKEEFDAKRQDLWASIKSKLKNVNRKKTTFEKKLGGKPKNNKFSNGKKFGNNRQRQQIKKR